VGRESDQLLSFPSSKPVLPQIDRKPLARYGRYGGRARSRLATPKLVAEALTASQSDATNYPPARHRTGDIMSEYRATSSRSARATSSESARDVLLHDIFTKLAVKKTEPYLL
jgi:hypothetical protein